MCAFVAITTDNADRISEPQAGEGGLGKRGRTRTPAKAQPIIFTYPFGLLALEAAQSSPPAQKIACRS
jgi:hypothetical protein